MKITKKTVMSVLTVVAIVVACVLGSVTMPKVGKGNGTNASISSLEQMRDLMYSIDGSSSSGRYNSDGNDEGEAPADKRYDSYTTTETASMYTTTTTSRGSSTTESTSSMDRELKIYRTATSAYYVSKGRIASKSHGSSAESKSLMDFYIHVYISGSSVYLYVEKLQYTYRYEYTDHDDSSKSVSKTENDTETGKMMRAFHRNRYRWIDISSDRDAAKAFINIDNSNMISYGEIGDAIDEELKKQEDDERAIYKDGSSYKLSEKKLLSLFGVNSELPELKIDFEIDLSDDEAPEINYSIKYNIQTEDKKNDYSRTGYVFCEANTVFENIGNTVVEFGKPDTIDIKDIIIK